jgi:hypothetical protein
MASAMFKFLAQNQPRYQPFVELVFWVVLGIALMVFTAYNPSLDDVLKGILMGAIVAVWSQVTSKITELRTRSVVQREERTRATNFVEQLTERATDHETLTAVQEVSRQINQAEDKDDVE